MMDRRAFATPKGLRPRRRVKPGDDTYGLFGSNRFSRPFQQSE
jgi:hypothetical protein